MKWIKWLCRALNLLFVAVVFALGRYAPALYVGSLPILLPPIVGLIEALLFFNHREEIMWARTCSPA